MKPFYTLLFFITSFIFAEAQIIDIPDLNFKDVLVNVQCADFDGDGDSDGDVDTNNDGEIDVSEAQVVYSLNLNFHSFSSMEGIEYFTNLESLSCGYNLSLTELDVSSNTQLNHLFCSNNQLTSLDLSQNTLLTSLDCGDNQLTDLDLSQNAQLETLNCSENQLTSIDLSQNTLLTYLHCTDNQLTNLNLIQNTQLVTVRCDRNELTNIEFANSNLIEFISCRDNELTNMDVLDFPNLTSLDCSGNNITSLDISQNINLENLYASDNNLTAIDVSNNLALNELFIDDNALTNLDVTPLINLERLNCGRNLFTELNVTQNVNLRELSIIYSELMELDISSNVSIEYLFCSNSELTELDLSANTSLIFLHCDNTNLTTLDVSSNGSLISLICSNIDNLETLFLKNGTNFSTDLAPNPSLVYICADESNIEYINEELDLYGMTDVVVNSYCSFTPGGEFYTLQGNAQYDANTDGCDTNDISIPHYLNYHITDGTTETTIVSDATGNYNIPLQSGNYTITPLIENPTHFNISPSTVNVVFPSNNSPFVQDFCLTPNGTVDDLEIIIIPINQARPGFDAHYRLFYRNKGNTTLSGTINFTFDDDYMDVVSTMPDADNTSTGNLDWDYANLMPFESGEIDIVMNLNTPTDTDFPLSGDDLLSFEVVISPVEDDIMAEDNTSSLEQLVVNSYDPNDKRCLEGDILNPDLVGEYVHYMIRFENTGTASAINVVIKDEIDTSKFDISTLTPLHASHNFVTRIQNTNQVEFIFENINLPFDDANNDGFVVFKIKTLNTLVLGDTFSNDAEIYFDFNAPIITNDYLTTVAEDNLSIDDFDRSTDVSIFPNPVNDLLTITSRSNLKSISISDINGRVIQTVSILGNQLDTSINIEDLSEGIYFVSVETIIGSTTEKIIKN